MGSPLLAKIYDIALAPSEWMGVRDQRRRLMDGLAGRVVEIGAGTGLNVPLYPADADEVHAVEPDRHMVEKLRSKVEGSATQIFLHRADAHHLPFTGSVFDAAIVTFALCTIPDPEQALNEAHRVVRAGGALRFLEHVRSENRRTAGWQDRATPLWGTISGGCRLNQPTVEILEATRWEMDDVWRSGRGSVIAGQALRT